MNDIDYFNYHNKINALKHEVEVMLAKQEELSAALKKIHLDLEELCAYEPTTTSVPQEQLVYHEPGNPHSQTPLEKIGDGG